ncbi:hypothetical protein HNY73_007291 [Argiope bruennichi]|uniref:Uncharacterized protein n=1 Tax=Argiope bruennichi TaxID=94029 RepID=A0A8T0FJ17_ARGBR|nr:hypothetical protein HNY73_007291 [Argiope bruennichi]
MDFISMCSKIQSEIQDFKNHINWLESQRISFMLKNFREDEVRLRNCIDEIQDFHRDMFVLPAAEEKQTCSKNGGTKSNYFVTKPGCSKNKPSNSMNKSEPSLPRLILKLPKGVLNKAYSTENDSDDESYDINDQSTNNRDELSDIKYESNVVKDASDSSKTESISSKTKSISSKAESISIKTKSISSKTKSISSKTKSISSKAESIRSKAESISSKAESISSKAESISSKTESEGNTSDSSNDENELAKKLLLDLLADSEREITISLLHLISKFSCFQRNLREAEVKAFQLGQIFPSGSNAPIKKLLKTLNGSVLYLDETVSNIYAKYVEMLHSVIH